MTHHTTTQQENIDVKYAFQSYYMKKYILVHFEIQKKLIVVGLFLLLAGFALSRPVLVDVFILRFEQHSFDVVQSSGVATFAPPKISRQSATAGQ